VDRLIRAGDLRAVRLLSSWCVDVRDLEAFIDNLDSNDIT
jgi:hypothetical protein